MPLVTPRRAVLAGLASLLAAPSIVRAASLMPVKAPRWREVPVSIVITNLGGGYVGVPTVTFHVSPPVGAQPTWVEVRYEGGGRFFIPAAA